MKLVAKCSAPCDLAFKVQWGSLWVFSFNWFIIPAGATSPSAEFYFPVVKRFFFGRLSWRQKKYAVAGTQFDKVIDLTRRKYGDDAVELIPIYQECGRVSFKSNFLQETGFKFNFLDSLLKLASGIIFYLLNLSANMLFHTYKHC